MNTQKRLALGSCIPLAPAAILVTAGLAQSLLGLHQLNDALDGLHAGVLFHPVILLGGLVLAIGLNLFPVLRFSVNKEQQMLTIGILLKQRLLNLLISGGGMMLLLIILSYSVGENFVVVPR